MDEKQFKALSVEQRKAVQRKLQDAGHYTGAIDGLWGGTTESAIKLEEKTDREAAAKAEGKEAAARADKLRETELELKREELRQQGKTKDVEDEGKAADTVTKLAKALRKKKYDEDASSGWGMAAQSGASVVAPALAGWAGLRFGQGVNEWMDEGQKGRNVTLRAAADDRVRGLTTREGAITGAKLAGAMPPSNALVRVLGRTAPHAGLAALAAAKGVQLLGDIDEDQPFYPRMADRAAGLGYLGFGGGILKRGIQQAQSPSVSPDAQALSVINSSQLRRNNQPPEDTGPKLTPRQTLVAEAKAAGITGTGKMNMTQLGSALRKIGGKTPLVGPAVAGALAYGMTPDNAEAADGTTRGGRGEALTNAGVVTGIGAGTGYGMNRLAKALGGAGRAAMGAGGAMLAPIAAADLYDPTDAELNRDRIDVASRLPEWMRFGALEEAGRATQVPERAPAGGDGFATARSLEIPEGIPLPRPDGELPPEMTQLEEAAAQDPELAQMLQELIMARLEGGEGQDASQPALMSSALRNLAQR